MSDITHSTIEDKIYEIRGVRVMLDFDLAAIYGMETKYLKRAVRANVDRFPSDFMFEVSKEEWKDLRCSFSTSKQQGGIRYMPFAFTEQGVAMLSSVLNSKTAIRINIAIMRAFISIRQMIASPPQISIESRMNKLEELLNDILIEQNEINEDTRIQIELLNEAIASMQIESPQRRKKMGFLIDRDKPAGEDAGCADVSNVG